MASCRLARARRLSGPAPFSRQDIELGLDDDYAVGISDANWQVSPVAVSKMVLRCSAIRRRLPSHNR